MPDEVKEEVKEPTLFDSIINQAKEAEVPTIPPTGEVKGEVKKGDSKEPDKGPPEQKKDDPAEKRAKDSAKWANEVHKQNLDLKRQLEIINQKLDGTYEPEVARTQLPEEQAAQAEVVGRYRASRAAAIDQFGEEYVLATIFNDDAPYKELEKDPLINARVMAADAPVIEAIKIVKEQEITKKYGKNPTEMMEKIRAEMKDEIYKQVVAEINGKRTPGAPAKTLGDVRGGERGQEPSSMPNKVDFDKIFPHLASTRL